MINSSLLELLYQCIDLFGQVNQCSSFLETGAIILASAIGVFATVTWARRVARRRATLDILLMEETKPEWTEPRRAFNKLCREQKGDLSKWAIRRNINSDNNNTVLIKTILNRYESVSIGISMGIIDEKAYKASCRSALVKDWRACDPFVAQLRQTTGNPALYKEFENLANRWATPEEKPHV